MENSIHTLCINLMFAISTLTDVVLFGIIFFMLYKIFKTKTRIIENNQEILDHDIKIYDLKEKVEDLTNGQ